jgi:hypothetical protein
VGDVIRMLREVINLHISVCCAGGQRE